MKISYNWLKQFINFKSSPQKLANDLIDRGVSVESINKINNDYILDFEITANRGDCLSILGISREISAIYDIPLKITIPIIKDNFIDKCLNISIEDASLCSRYSARIIDNIQIKKSPLWIIKKIESYGFKSINNIVDITNYIMLETGQPMHAFDYDKISNGIVRICKSKKGQSIITIDGKERKLDDNSIIISDDKKIYDLSGIMGGFNTEIDSKTKTILLQSAVFNPYNIRNTSQKLRHITDASYRYERGVDHNNTILALNKASAIIKKIIPKSIIGKIIDIDNNRLITKNIKLDYKKVNSILGLNLSQNQISNYLKKLNIIRKPNNYYQVPSYRIYDIKIDVDLIEEIARIYGYKKIKPTKLNSKKTIKTCQYLKKEAIKDCIIKNGFNELYSYSFVDERIIKLLNININDCTEIINPISPELKYLRPNLLPSILTAFSKNPWAPEIKIFEIGKVFSKNSEYYMLYIATSIKNDPDLATVAKKLNIPYDIKIFDQKILDYLKIRKKIYYLSTTLEGINLSNYTIKKKFNAKKYVNISEFPPTIRDLAFIVDDKISSEKIYKDILKNDNHIFIVEQFDEFKSNKFGKNKKNIAFHIWMQDEKSPMTDKKINTIINKIIKIITNKYKARLR